VSGKKPELSDDFSAKQLGIQWQFFKGYNPERISLDSGVLTLAADGTTWSDTSVMACIAGDRSYTVEIDIEIEEGCEAGLLLFYNQSHALGLTLGPKGIGFLRNNSKRNAGIAATRATFRIVNDQQEVEMYYRLPGQPWVHRREGADITSYNDNSFGDFLDVRPAIYAAGTNHAQFRAFQYTSVAVAPKLSGW
jgi:xylan 1,4-beta-xylosidase